MIASAFSPQRVVEIGDVAGLPEPLDAQWHDTGLAWGLTATRWAGCNTSKYSAVISVTTEAEDAW